MQRVIMAFELTRWSRASVFLIVAGLALIAGSVNAADEITDEDLQWERLSRQARAGMSFDGAAQTVNYYFIQRPDTLGRIRWAENRTEPSWSCRGSNSS